MTSVQTPETLTRNRYSRSTEAVEGELPRLRWLLHARDAAGELSRHRFAQGELICSAGAYLDSLHIVEKGIIELSRVEGGEDFGVLLLSSGDLLYPAAGLFGEPCLTSARAITPVRTSALAVEDLRSEAGSDPHIGLELCRVIGGQWRMAVRHILDLKCRSASQRLASFLLRLADESPVPGVAQLPFSKGALAARIGVSRETLSRAAQVVAEEGVLLRGRQIQVRDRARVERFCGDPYPGSDERALEVHAL